MLIKAIIVTILIESVTVIGRFCFNFQSQKNTAFMAKYTFGYRIHHGYIGLLLIIIYLIFAKTSWKYIDWVFIIGFALLFSDLIHHFIVLKLTKGSPEFFIKY